MSWLQLGALYHLSFVLFHLAFPILFGWKQDLHKLRPVNRAIMQVLNLRLTFLFLLFAWISWQYPSQLLEPGLGRCLVAGMAVFWWMRSAEQLLFFAWKPRLLMMVPVFLLGALIYTLAWFS